MQSINEELQSTNEELETSKEELQSVNEELATVNAELQIKVEDLSRANNDMNNLLAGTGVATLFVDHGLRITRFTPTAVRLIKLIQGDVGRPVGDIVSNLVGYDRLVEDVRGVLATLIPVEQEVETRSGSWYLMRVGPYRTLENVIEGAVITFVDISARKRMEDALRQARALSDGILDTLREPLLVLDRKLGVVSANRAFYRYFRTTAAETEGRPFRALGNGQWNIPALLERLAEIRSQGTRGEDFQVTHDFPGVGVRTFALNARWLAPGSDTDGDILIAMEDLTERTGSGHGAQPAAPPTPPGGIDDTHP
jgi:two-component system CheB/CheR fusion protein